MHTHLKTSLDTGIFAEFCVNVLFALTSSTNAVMHSNNLELITLDQNFAKIF